MQVTTVRPGGTLARRPLHFFFLVDCSGSMAFDGKIQALNTAIREAIPHMRRAAQDNANANVFLRVITFSDGAQWHVGEPTPIEHFVWADVSAAGVTDMGHAFTLVAEKLQAAAMPDRALPPVLVLVSDGQPTDNFEDGLRSLLGETWGQRAIRMAVAIGRDADHEVLQRFIDNVEYRPVSASNPEALVERIKWASTAGLKAASSPTGAGASTRPIPQPPPAYGDGVTPVW
jgi:uncharacterized protein YegL